MSKPEMSPSGKYGITVESLPTRPGCWNVTRGTVSAADGREIAVVDRNYSAFPTCWIEGHPDGHDYLLCGADYQGQTLVRLDTGERWDYVPPEAREGHGFCFASMLASPDKKTIAVDGCYWAAPYEVRMYDFTVPGLPLLLLGGHPDDNITFGEWVSDAAVMVGREVSRRISDGADCDRLTVEQENADGLYDAAGEYDPEKVRTSFEAVPWTRPTYAEAAESHEGTLRHRLKHDVPLHVDWINEYERACALAGESPAFLAECRAKQIDDAAYNEILGAKRAKREAERAAQKAQEATP